MITRGVVAPAIALITAFNAFGVDKMTAQAPVGSSCWSVEIPGGWKPAEADASRQSSGLPLSAARLVEFRQPEPSADELLISAGLLYANGPGVEFHGAVKYAIRVTRKAPLRIATDNEWARATKLEPGSGCIGCLRDITQRGLRYEGHEFRTSDPGPGPAGMLPPNGVLSPDREWLAIRTFEGWGWPTFGDAVQTIRRAGGQGTFAIDVFRISSRSYVWTVRGTFHGFPLNMPNWMWIAPHYLIVPYGKKSQSVFDFSTFVFCNPGLDIRQ